MLDITPVEIRERLASGYFSASALRDCRLAQRDAAYRGLAVGIVGKSGFAIAQAIRAEVERYCRGAWRFDRGRAPPVSIRAWSTGS